MLYTLDVNLPHEQLPVIPVLYNLELIRNRGESRLSIHHRDQIFGKSRVNIPYKIKREMNNDIYIIEDRIYFPREVKSRVYQFSPEFELDCYSVHGGDFRKDGFRWLETRQRLFEGEDIRYRINLHSHKLAERLWDSIRKKKQDAKKVLNQDYYGRFVSTLENIVKKHLN